MAISSVKSPCTVAAICPHGLSLPPPSLPKLHSPKQQQRFHNKLSSGGASNYFMKEHGLLEQTAAAVPACSDRSTRHVQGNGLGEVILRGCRNNLFRWPPSPPTALYLGPSLLYNLYQSLLATTRLQCEKMHNLRTRDVVEQMAAAVPAQMHIGQLHGTLTREAVLHDCHNPPRWPLCRSHGRPCPISN